MLLHTTPLSENQLLAQDGLGPHFSHTATVERRSGSTFTPASVVQPNEPIRLLTTGATILGLPFIDTVFVLERMLPAPTVGQERLAPVAELLRRNVRSNVSGDAFLDVAAPSQPGIYQLTVHAQSLPFLTRTHPASVTFRVDANAPAPPSQPPSDNPVTEVARGIAKVLEEAPGLVLLVVIGVALSKLPKLGR